MDRFNVKLTNAVEARDPEGAVRAFIERAGEHGLESYVYVVTNQRTGDQFMASLQGALPLDEALDGYEEDHQGDGADVSG